MVLALCDYYLDHGHSQSEDIGGLISEAQTKAAADWRSDIKTFYPKSDDLMNMPAGTWLLRVDFSLRKPYTSKAEGEFRPLNDIQNAIIRDHLTSFPVVQPTTWKGHLAFAARSQELDHQERLFGSASGDTGEAGRLHFFPTFFDTEPAHEVVTPLSRDTRTPARGALKFEVIKAGSKGSFHLLYVPRPLPLVAEHMAGDLEGAALAVKSMLLDYGFSAKKTSGWGVTDDKVDGKLAGAGTIWPQYGPDKKPDFVEPPEILLKFMEKSGAADSRLIKSSGEWLSRKEFKAAGTGIGSLNEYAEFRRWYEDNGTEWQRRNQSGAKSSGKILREYSFATLTELADVAVRISAEIRKAANA